MLLRPEQFHNLRAKSFADAPGLDDLIPLDLAQ
jgi:hypothetical protein